MTRRERTEIGLEGETDNVGRDEGPARSHQQTRLLHRMFEVGVLAKGIDGAFELIGGLVLLLLSPAAIRGTIFFLVRGELKEDPTDLLANLLLHSTGTVIQTKVPASAFLIVHGAVKLVLVAGLATNKLWSYPAAIVVFAAFTVYQMYQLAHQSSLFLEVVTVLDIIVVLLVIAEYRYVRHVR
jgi:uncharacterized membrane protein